MFTQSWLTLVIELLFVFIVLQIILVIVLENRNPYKTTSWLLILTFLPILGLVLYLIFGQEYRKRYNIPKKLRKGLENKSLPTFNVCRSPFRIEGYNKLITLFENIADSYIHDGNKVDFYIDGAVKFAHFFEDIENAKHHVHILYYKIEEDKLGHAFRDLLLKKVREGVEVRVLYDDVGSLKTRTKFFNVMKDGGIEVEAFLPVKLPRFARSLNYRNHKKLAVIDGQVGYIGGMNIGDNYIEGVSWGIWRDMQIRIEGAGSKALQQDFLTDWYYMHKSVPEDINKYFPDMERFGNNPLQIVSSGPIDVFQSIERGLFQAIMDAKKSIYIQTPYFIPSERILSAIQTASISGVDVHVMIPKKSDNFFVDGATYSFIRDLLYYNVKVYLYSAGFIHTKCMVVDEFLTAVGSANMDNRSFELSFEADAFIYDSQSALTARDIFLNDVKDSILIDKTEWKKRPWTRWLFESIMRIFTPVL